MNTLALLGLVASLAVGGASQNEPLRVTKSGKTTRLSLGLDHAFHSTSNPVSNARGLRVPGSDALVAHWSEKVGRSIVPHFAVSLDGVEVQQSTSASFDIMARAGRFDPLTQPAPVRRSLEAGLGNETYIVQFVTKALEPYRAELRRLGAEVEDYYPNHAHIVRMDATVKQRVAALPFVRAIVPYHPEFKVEEWVKPRLVGGTLPTLRYYIGVFHRGLEQKTLVANYIRTVGGTVHFCEEPGFLLEATLTPVQLSQVLRLNEVAFVDRWSEMGLDMNNIRAIGGANYLVTVGNYRGQGVRGEVFDAGFRTTHVGFNPPPATTLVPIIHAAGPVASHGTSTYGIVFGDGDSSAGGVGVGMMPYAQGVMAYYGGLLGGAAARYTHTSQLVQAPYNCLFQTSSVGDTQITFYSNISQQMDDILFNFDITHLQSQSNTGNQNSRPQAWAKNIVSVGAQYHFDNTNEADDRWNGGASIGPAEDGRIKPDLSNAYDATYTATSTSDTAYTTSFGGTSGATPITAGHFGLFFQLWSSGLFGNCCLNPALSVFQNRPKASLAKALMINRARQYGLPEAAFGHDMNRYRQGWGKADLIKVYDTRSKVWFINESDALQDLQAKQYKVWVNAAEPELKITMVYTEPPGTTSATMHIKNNLSLKVTSPGGTIYWGNFGLTTSNWSASGGTEDNRNTVENVFVQNPQSGAWTVEVIATDITTDARVESAAVDADYALVATGVLPAINPTSFTTSGGSLAGGNLQSLLLSDENKLVLGESNESDSTDVRRWIQVIGQSPTGTLSGLGMHLEHSGSRPSLRADVKFYNFTTGVFDVVATGIAIGTADACTDVAAPSNWSQYVEGTNRTVIARVEAYDIATSSDEVTLVRLDQLRWTFRP